MVSALKCTVLEIRIDDQELEVLSSPGPDCAIRLQDLRAGKAVSRRYRNWRIGECLKEWELTEGRSTGAPKILRVRGGLRKRQ